MIEKPDEDAVEGIERRLRERAGANRWLRLWEVEALVWPAYWAHEITLRQVSELILKHMHEPPRDPLP